MTALTDVQADLARRYQDASATGFDKNAAKAGYCEIDSLLVAAGKKGVGTIACR